jgi:hypothetical protein
MPAAAGRACRTLRPSLPRPAGRHQRHGRRPDRRSSPLGGAGGGPRARDPAARRRQAGGPHSDPPRHEVARALFDPLGGVIAVDDERALDALSTSTATIAAHLAYLDTISRWLADRGIPHTDATRYVAAVFGALSGTVLGTHAIDLRALADEVCDRRRDQGTVPHSPPPRRHLRHRRPRTRRRGRSTRRRLSPAGRPAFAHPDGAMSPGATGGQRARLLASARYRKRDAGTSAEPPWCLQWTKPACRWGLEQLASQRPLWKGRRPSRRRPGCRARRPPVVVSARADSRLVPRGGSGQLRRRDY